QSPQLLAGGDVPDPEGVVAAADRDQGLAVGRKRERVDLLARRPDRALLLAGRRVQDAERPLVAANQVLAVGGEDQRAVRVPAMPPADAADPSHGPGRQRVAVPVDAHRPDRLPAGPVGGFAWSLWLRRRPRPGGG